mgnify:CR=1 FL=1
MKQVYFIIAMLCGLALGGQAQGIRFAEGSWKELLETAGLIAPFTALLSRELAEAGIDIQPTLNTQVLAEELCRLK